MKPEPLGARRRKGYARKKSRTAEPEMQQVLVYDPEEGWDDETDPYCKVLEYGDEETEVDRRESCPMLPVEMVFMYQIPTQVSRSLPKWSILSQLRKAPSFSKRFLETETSLRQVSSSSRQTPPNQRRPRETTPLYVLQHNALGVYIAHEVSPRCSTSSKVQSSSLCTRRVSFSPPAECSWSLEVSTIRS